MRTPLLASDLRALGACSDQVALFGKTFPNGALPTLRTVRKAQKAGLSLGWLAERLLEDSPASAAYDAARAQAWAAYDAARAPARAAYEAAIAPASAAYEAARASAWAAYDAARASAWAAYDAAVAQAWAAYDAARAPARAAYDAAVASITADALSSHWPD